MLITCFIFQGFVALVFTLSIYLWSKLRAVNSKAKWCADMKRDTYLKALYGVILLSIGNLSLSCDSNAVVTFYSQFSQDEFIHTFLFPHEKNGVFVDIGAHDGKTYSNTLFFERHRGWTGVCIEPMPDIFAQLRANRSCVCIEGCICDKKDRDYIEFLRVHSSAINTEMLSGILENYETAHLERVEREVSSSQGWTEIIKVKCYNLNELLAGLGLFYINYLSIDTEGGELDILKSIDFDRFMINVIEVENNYNDPNFEIFMQAKGFRKIVRIVCDEIYVRSSWYQDSCNHHESIAIPLQTSYEFEKFMRRQGWRIVGSGDWWFKKPHSS